MTESMAADRSQAKPGPRPPGEESPTLAAYLRIALMPAPTPAPSERGKRLLRRLRSLRGAPR
jgi:hypothetical protein